MESRDGALELARALAKGVGTAAWTLFLSGVDPMAATLVAGAGPLVEWLQRWLGLTPDELARFLKELERGLKELYREERDREKIRLALGYVRELLEAYGDAPVVAGVEPDAERYAREVLKANREQGRVNVPTELHDLVERMLEEFYRAALASEKIALVFKPDTLPRLAANLGHALWELRSRLDRLEWEYYFRAYNQLNRPWQLRPAETLGLGAIKAKGGVVPFKRLAAYGRLVQELQGLGPGVHTRVVTGPGGAGKTRLAIELGKALSEAGWVAGVLGTPVNKHELFSRLLSPNNPLTQEAKGAFFVIDYAEHWGNELKDTYGELARAGALAWGRPIVFLILGRKYPEGLRDLRSSCEAEGGGVEESSGASEVPGWGKICKEVSRDLGNPAHHLVLEELLEEEARGIFDGAYDALLALKRPSDMTPMEKGEAWRRALASGPHPKRPLVAAAAAMLAVAGVLFAPLSRERERVDCEDKAQQGLLEQLLCFEVNRRWKELLKSRFTGDDTVIKLYLSFIRRAVVLASLLGGLKLAEAEALFKEEEIGRENREKLKSVLKIFYPGDTEEEIAPLEPDPVADLLIRDVWRYARAVLARDLALVLKGEMESLDLGGASLKRRVSIRRFLKAEETLHRAVSPLTKRELLSFWQGVLSRLDLPAEAWWIFYWAVKPEDEAHPSLVTAFATAALERFLASSKQDVEGSLNFIGALANHYHALGLVEEAVGHYRELVEVRRTLAEQEPEKHLPNLAGDLNNLGVYLFDLGRPEEALQATKEAAEIYRKLAAKNPNSYLPYLAASLNNLGGDLSALNRHEEALKITKEAVEIRRELAENNPETYLPDLAVSLSNLGNRFTDLGRHGEAFRAAEETIKICRQMVAKNPEIYLPDLARSLTNLGVALYGLSHHKEALKATEDAVEIYRELVEKNPEAYLPYLATSLTTLGAIFTALGHLEEALRATEEAVKLYRELAARNPEAYLPDLAGSLNNLGRALSVLGRPEEALAACREAVEALKGHYLRYPRVTEHG